MSIEEAWSNVEFKNDGIKSSSDDLSRAQLKKESAKSMYLPSISISGSYTHLSEPIGLEGEIDLRPISPALPLVPYSLDLSKQDVFLSDLHLLWPLYTGGKIDTMQNIYNSQVSEAKALKDMKKDIEFLKLIKYYYGVVVADSLYRTRQKAQKALQIHYENAKKLKDEGQIAKIELLNAQVKFDSAKIDTTKAKHKLEIAKSALISITKSKSKPSSNLFVNESLQDQEYYINQTTQNYAGLKVLQEKQNQTKSVIALKKAAWHPSVAAYGNYNLYKDDSPIMNTLPTWFAGVMVKIDILKRADRNQEIQIAELLNSKVRHLKAQAIEDLELLVEKTYKEMISSKEEFNSLNSSIKLSHENYKLRSIAFREGLSTSVELVDAQMFLLGVQTKRLNAAYTFVKKLSQLSVLSGDREMFFKISNKSQEIENDKE